MGALHFQSHFKLLLFACCVVFRGYHSPQNASNKSEVNGAALPKKGARQRGEEREVEKLQKLRSGI